MNKQRLVWLCRRLSRISPAEIPYRIQSLLRITAQSHGFFDARRCPPLLSASPVALAWVRVPTLDSHEREQLIASAESLLREGVPIFDIRAPLGLAGPEWNCDPKTGKQIPMTFGLAIDFRAIEGGVDIKYLWELSRHLWLVRLAQAYAVSDDKVYLHAIGRFLKSWLNACLYPNGPNWSSPVEHGIRLINWSLTWHLIGGEKSPLFEGEAGAALLASWRTSIYQHIRFASDNYSLHSSSNNHLLGEAAGVFVAGQTWDYWSDVRELRQHAKSLLENEALKQFATDGVNLEQAFGYHHFALQFLLAAGLCGRMNANEFSSHFWGRIESAMVFMAAMLDCAGHAPSIGDSDDGEIFCLGYSPMRNKYHSMLALGAKLFDRPDLQAKVQQVGKAVDCQSAWFLTTAAPSATSSDLLELPSQFKAGGYAILGHRLHTPDEFRITVDCGPLGYNGIAGHGHADALSILVSARGEELLVDPGTYCYNSSPEWRHFFRGTRAHNTLTVDGQDQSIYGGSFLWLQDIKTKIFTDQSSEQFHACHDGYRRLADSVIHHRRVTLARDGDAVEVEDWLECKEAHSVELHWHAAATAKFVELPGVENVYMLEAVKNSLRVEIDPGEKSIGTFESLIKTGACNPIQGWVSSEFYKKTPAPVLCIRALLFPNQVIRTRFICECREPNC
ncbi:heparinase II/III family protein [Paucibacter sp. Y2R2-4]|uniref:heparinase II/III family protein n=1 Tax=Paucibacter sp. Y2R2-4 TaxID=2893553 RepID=UPI0021E3C8C6|nr:alginate lyase family protein [Paucibacter sp. Y2R2-4]MCV2349259.1 heparinase II/III family protein [Paucibacter sp. Y2R2-4]